MIRSVILLFGLLLSFGSKAQMVNGDLNTAKPIIINKLYSIPASPKGFGNFQEFPENYKRSPYLFEVERNTIWFVIDIPFNGILTFEIMPHRKEDDYDWMLFNYNPKLESQVRNGDAFPIRSNNSRNDVSLKGMTGLKNGYPDVFEAPGPGKSFSSALNVKSGQRLALVIDNIYEKGLGFNFISHLKLPVLAFKTLSGSVKDINTSLPLTAKIVCEDDSTGIKVSETTADKNGFYTLKIPTDRPVNVTATYPGYLFQTADIKAEPINSEQDFSLNKIANMQKIDLFNIHFMPDKHLIKPSSEPELERLVEVLKLQKDYDIRLIGHTNNNPFADARYLQKLSFNRAVAVKQYLTGKGISEKRISCTGVGGKQPLIVTQDVEERLRNLRVEVVFQKK
ncbi:MAG TPA: OmpA family protein [Pedobacter sp.]|jgi:outer membrane protein OmpA-like peptidoglycan-associated protein